MKFTRKNFTELRELVRTQSDTIVEITNDVVKASLQVRELEGSLETAESNYRFMVERAADQKLDGYRELGAKAADAEERADRLSSELAAIRKPGPATDSSLEELFGMGVLSHIRLEGLRAVYNLGLAHGRSTTSEPPADLVEAVAKAIDIGLGEARAALVVVQPEIDRLKKEADEAYRHADTIVTQRSKLAEQVCELTQERDAAVERAAGLVDVVQNSVSLDVHEARIAELTRPCVVDDALVEKLTDVFSDAYHASPDVVYDAWKAGVRAILAALPTSQRTVSRAELEKACCAHWEQWCQQSEGTKDFRMSKMTRALQALGLEVEGESDPLKKNTKALDDALAPFR